MTSKFRAERSGHTGPSSAVASRGVEEALHGRDPEEGPTGGDLNEAPPDFFAPSAIGEAERGQRMSGTLETIIELDRATNELEHAERQLAGVPEWMEELHAEHSAQQAAVDELRQAAEDAAADRRSAEAAAEDGRQKLSRYQDQIRQVRTQREYSALLQEIDTAKEEIRQAEEDALAAMERQEEARERLQQAEEEFSGLDQRYGEALAKWEEEKPEVRERRQELTERIQILRERLPRGLLAQYDRIRERHEGQALAPVRRIDRSAGGPLWTCSACNYQVRQQSVVAVRRALEGSQDDVVMCDSCRRILILEDPST